MDHGGEATRPTTTVESSIDFGMPSAVQGGEVFHGQLGAAAAHRTGIDGFQPSAAARHDPTVFARQVRSVPVAVFHREPGPGVAYANIGLFWRQPGPVGVVLVVRLQLPDGVMPVHGNSALQPRLGAGHGEVLGDMFPVPDGAPHAAVFVGLFPGSVHAVYDTYGYYPWLWQPRPGAGHGEVFIGPLDGVGMVFYGLGNFAQQTVSANLGAGYDGSVALADDLGAMYDNRGMAADLRRLFAFVGIGASSVAVNGLATGTGSPAVAFCYFALLLGGLVLVILHVLRV